MSADLFEAFGKLETSAPEQVGKPSSVPIGTPPIKQTWHQDSLLDFAADPPPGLSLSNQGHNSQIDYQWNQNQPQRQPSLFHRDPTSGTDVLFDAADTGSDLDDDEGNDQDVFEDDFGEFQTVPQESAIQSPHVINSSTKSEWKNVTESKVEISRAQSAIDLLGLDDEDAKTKSVSNLAKTSTQTQTHRGLPMVPRDVSVDTETFDDWGDFTSPIQSVPNTNSSNKASSNSQPTANNEFGPAGPVRHGLAAGVGGLVIRGVRQPASMPTTNDDKASPATRETQGYMTQPILSHIAKAKVASSEGNENEWQDFVDGPTSASTKTSTNRTIECLVPSPIANSTSSSPAAAQRPSNIPPSSILFQVFPQIIHQKRKETPSPMSTDPPSKALAQSLEILHGTATKLIAGRSLRWKRDTVLSQSMKISAAGTGTSRGMKLTALDKTESLKEEREVEELIGVWQRNAHAFNSLVTKAGLRSKSMVSLTLHGLKVRQITGVGAFTAKEPCALCGLKRDERVIGVDVDIEDSFGEWWIDYWGHRGCWQWWEDYNGLLKQR
ncbi:hypothetical protein UCRPC4_g03783 [Phaeomoniella chlamydospora]|uniref:Serine threonine-protein kinase ppk6 n=1 Tax=Phaeomoniella chlamydospora TaxID=158046 RepID=A0A0G2EER6_PHACM|nr:hypothetical protein UCRPC4_g03783 [Phaeomoniella chlamydospora]